MHGTERERLLHTMSSTSAHRFRVVLNCGLGLAFLFLIARIGLNEPGERGFVREARNPSSDRQWAPMVTAAEVYRKDVFDERRMHFLSSAESNVQPKGDEAVGRAERGKLSSDPRFNGMDGLDVYIGDYSKFEPLPNDWLRALAPPWDEPKLTDRFAALAPWPWFAGLNPATRGQ